MFSLFLRGTPSKRKKSSHLLSKKGTHVQNENSCSRVKDVAGIRLEYLFIKPAPVLHSLSFRYCRRERYGEEAVARKNYRISLAV
jgi:hypothetical protein